MPEVPRPLSIAQRPLDDSGGTISAVVWELDRAPGPDDHARISESRSFGGRWFSVPATLLIDVLAQWRPLLESADRVIVGVASDDLVSRRSAALQDRLHALGLARCEAVLLQDAETDSLKAGRPFHRLSQLRDAGLARFLFLDAPSAEVGEWMV